MCDVQCDVESDVHAEAGDLQVIFHDDDETPVQFVIELLHSVFKKQLADAIRLTEAVDQHGQAICGTYPRDVANQVLEAARQRVRASGHPLRITSEAVAEGGDRDGVLVFEIEEHAVVATAETEAGERRLELFRVATAVSQIAIQK